MNRLAARLVLYALAAFIAVWLVCKLHMLLIILVMAFSIAAAISPLADALEKRRVPRIVTVLVLYLAIGLLYVVLASRLVPAVKEQGHTLVANLPAYVDKLDVWYHKGLEITGTDARSINFTADDLRALAGKFFRQSMDVTAGVVGLVLNGILTLFLAGYFAVESHSLNNSLAMWLPKERRDVWAKLLPGMANRVGGYVRGQVMVAAAVAAFFMIGLSLLRINYALALGMLAGVLNVVPYVGSLIATIFALVVAFNQSPTLAVLVFVLFAVEQWLESSVFVPFLLGSQVELHPLVVLLSIIAGGSLLGVAGALISIPLVTAGIYLAEQIYLIPMHEKEKALAEAKPDGSA